MPSQSPVCKSLMHVHKCLYKWRHPVNLNEESKASWLEVFTDMLLQGHDCMDFFLGILMHAVMSHIRDEDFFLL